MEKVFNCLSYKREAVPLHTVRAWSGLSTNLSSKGEEVETTISRVCGSQATSLSCPQFVQLIQSLHSDEDLKDYVGKEAMILDGFDQLRGNDAEVEANALKSWELLSPFLEAGIIGHENLDEMISEICDVARDERGSDRLSMNYQQFRALLHRIDVIASEAHSQAAVLEAGELEQEEQLQIEESNLEEHFNHLRGDNPRVSSAAIKAWPIVQYLIENNAISNDSLESLLMEIGTVTEDGISLDYAQFVEFAHNMDVATRECGVIGDFETEEVDEIASVEDTLLQTIFDQLREPTVQDWVTVGAIKQWDVIQHLIETSLLTYEILDSLILEVIAQTVEINDSIELNIIQFVDLAHKIDAITSSPSDNRSDGAVEEALLHNMFAYLSQGNDRVAFQAIKEWDVIRHLIFSGVLTASDVDDFLAEQCVDGDPDTGLSFHQFAAFAHQLDAVVTDFQAQQAASSSSWKSEGESTEETEQTEIVVESLLRDVFDQLRAGSPKISSDAIKSWNAIQHLLAQESITINHIDAFIVTISGGESALDFTQFIEFSHWIDAASRGEDIAKFETTGDSEGNKEYQESIEDSLLRVVFDQLRKGSEQETVAVQTVKQWDVIQHLINTNSISNEVIDSFICQVLGIDLETVDWLDMLLDFTQFADLAHKIDSASTTAMDSSGDHAVEEALLRDIFDRLRGENDGVHAAALKEWDVLNHLVPSGALSAGSVDNYFAEECGGNGELNFDQFVSFAHRIDAEMKANIQ